MIPRRASKSRGTKTLQLVREADSWPSAIDAEVVFVLQRGERSVVKGPDCSTPNGLNLIDDGRYVLVLPALPRQKKP